MEETEGAKHTCVIWQEDRPGHSRDEYPRKDYPFDAVEGEELCGGFRFGVQGLGGLGFRVWGILSSGGDDEHEHEYHAQSGVLPRMGVCACGFGC